MIFNFLYLYLVGGNRKALRVDINPKHFKHEKIPFKFRRSFKQNRTN